MDVGDPGTTQHSKRERMLRAAIALRERAANAQELQAQLCPVLGATDAVGSKVLHESATATVQAPAQAMGVVEIPVSDAHKDLPPEAEHPVLGRKGSRGECGFPSRKPAAAEVAHAALGRVGSVQSDHVSASLAAGNAAPDNGLCSPPDMGAIFGSDDEGSMDRNDAGGPAATGAVLGDSPGTSRESSSGGLATQDSNPEAASAGKQPNPAVRDEGARPQMTAVNHAKAPQAAKIDTRQQSDGQGHTVSEMLQMRSSLPEALKARLLEQVCRPDLSTVHL